MSHEIRTPMNGIIGMLTLAENKLEANSPAMQYLTKADELRISQVIINFLSNAVKFTSEGEIIVTFRQMMLQNGVADFMIRVHDTGIGIPPFRQRTNARRQSGANYCKWCIQRQYLCTCLSGEADRRKGEGAAGQHAARTRAFRITELYADRGFRSQTIRIDGCGGLG